MEEDILNENDLVNFKEKVDKMTDVNVLFSLIDQGIKQQIIREKNMQYVSKRIKTLITKNMNKDIKESQPKKIVRGGINTVFSISNALCTLLNYPKGSKKSWTQITADIWKYISDNNLKDPDNKTMIIPDEPLKKCLGIKKTSIKMLDLPSYLSNLCKYNKSVEDEKMDIT